MSRILTWINLGGVLVLTVLCIFQWRANRGLNLQVNDLEATRFAQATQLSEQTKKISGLTADLERFRQQLGTTTFSAKETAERLQASELLATQLANERDQLKTSLARWTAAIDARDQLIQDANARISALAAQLRDTVTKYNALVQQVNDARAHAGADTQKTATPSAAASP